jgi:hypothetical protein
LRDWAETTPLASPGHSINATWTRILHFASLVNAVLNRLNRQHEYFPVSFEKASPTPLSRTPKRGIQTPQDQARTSRSNRLGFGFFTVWCSTPSWWRSAMISSCNAARVRKQTVWRRAAPIRRRPAGIDGRCATPLYQPDPNSREALFTAFGRRCLDAAPAPLLTAETIQGSVSLTGRPVGPSRLACKVPAKPADLILAMKVRSRRAARLPLYPMFAVPGFRARILLFFPLLQPC